MGFGPHGAEPSINTDYKIYTLDKAPQLQNFEQSLKQQGLKDPWLRNEAWRFMGPDKLKQPTMRSIRNIFKMFPQAFAAALTTVALTKMYQMTLKEENDHH